MVTTESSAGEIKSMNLVTSDIDKVKCVQYIFTQGDGSAGRRKLRRGRKKFNEASS